MPESKINNIPDGKLASHQIRVYFPLDALDPQLGPQIKFKSLIPKTEADKQTGISAMLPVDQIPACQSRYADKPIWEKIEGQATLPISYDLTPHIRELLSGKSPKLLSVWTLTSLAKRFVKTADLYDPNVEGKSRRKKNICLDLSSAAKVRLQSSGIDISQLIVDINDIQVWVFSTGVSVASAQIKLRSIDRVALSATSLVEAVAALSRINTCHWVSAEDCKKVPSPEFSIGTFITTLVQGSGAKFAPSRRAMTYTFARLSAPMVEQDVNVLSAYLARRYTSSYDYVPDKNNIKILHDFSSIRHAIAAEGAASIVAPNKNGETPEFLENWETSVFRSAYSFIFLLALHENLFLTDSRYQSLATHMNDNAIEELSGIVDDALMFRLYYRHSEVSGISMHNAFSKKLRESLGLDKKLDDLQKDVDAVSTKIISNMRTKEADEENKKYRKYYWVSIFAAASLAGLTSYTIAKEIGSLIWHTDKIKAGWIAVGFGGLIMILAAVIGGFRAPKKKGHHQEGHITTHAMLEHMIKRALK